jgi:hypothetical protein
MNKKWSWRKFKYINTEIPIKKLMDDLLAIFTMDSEIRKVIMSDEFPW